MAVTLNGYCPGAMVESVLIVNILLLASLGSTVTPGGEKAVQEAVAGKPLQPNWKVP